MEVEEGGRAGEGKRGGRETAAAQRCGPWKKKKKEVDSQRKRGDV